MKGTLFLKEVSQVRLPLSNPSPPPTKTTGPNQKKALDPWKTSLLVKTKRLIGGGGVEGQEEVDLT